MQKLLFREEPLGSAVLTYTVAAVVVLLFIIWRALDGPIAFPIDDAYITLHNAQVLLDGEDTNFPGVSPLIGATSQIHLLLVAGFALVFGLPLASFIVGGLALIAYVLGLVRLTFQAGGSIVLAALVVLLGTMTGYAYYHLLSGLETCLAMAAVTWAIILSNRGGWPFALLCGLMPFIRPELGVLSALLLIERRSILEFALVAMTAVPFIAWQWVETGHLVPQTWEAKRAFFADLSSEWWWAALGYWYSGVVPLIPALIFKPRLALVGFVGAVFATTALLFPTAAYHNYARYEYVLVPAMLAALLTALKYRSTVALFVLTMSVSAIAFYAPWGAYRYQMQWTRTELFGIAQRLNQVVPNDARIMIHDAGYVSYATNFHFIDAVGLKTPKSIAINQQYGRPEGVSRIAALHRAGYLVLLNRDPFWLQIADAMRERGWKLEVISEPAGIGYVIYSISAKIRESADSARALRARPSQPALPDRCRGTS